MPASDERQRSALLSFVTPVLSSGEQVVAVLPYVNTPKRPKGPEGKVREGIWQAKRRYRPLVLTNRRLFVFDTARTPHPRAVLCELPSGSSAWCAPSRGRWEERRWCSSCPADGEVPFELGRLDVVDLDAFTSALDGRPDS